eukprot:scaffold242945_cov19-Tisochrysis_lutea.AAC.1
MAARLRPAELSPHDILHYNAEAVRVMTHNMSQSALFVRVEYYDHLEHERYVFKRAVLTLVFMHASV